MINAVNVGFFNQLKTWPTTWVASTPKVVGDIIKPISYNSRTYVCSIAGTTKTGDPPTWGTTVGGTTVDGGVTWVCFDMKTYNIKAPQGAIVPYITFGLNTDRPIGDFGDSYTIEDLTYWVNVFTSTSVANVTTLTDLVLAVMDGATLTVSGYNHLTCRREFMGSIMWDSETGIYQIPLRYRVWENKA